jgi:alkylation response protein AidB-like acyl-CoA dehydrogenase
LQDLSTTQRTVGEAEAIWGSAKAYLRETASAMWEGACQNRSLTYEERIRLRLASTYGIRKAGEVVDIAYTLCGSDAIFATSPVQRRFRDVHTITQQIQGRLSHYDTAGQFFLGLEPEGIF